jgi:hypothetical protein
MTGRDGELAELIGAELADYGPKRRHVIVARCIPLPPSVAILQQLVAATIQRTTGRVNEAGGHETKASIANKLSRAQFSAMFFIEVLAAIGVQHLDLHDINK